MGIRFHRSVKIAKGVRLNLSKSGPGVSFGPKGSKISFGSNGVYSNIGVPGTGLYSRTKLNTSSTKKNYNKKTNTTQTTNEVSVKISIDDETGKEDIRISKNGSEISDPSLIRKIKLDPAFKEKRQHLREKTNNIINEKTQELIEIHKLSKPLPNWNLIKKEFNNNHLDYYKKKDFNVIKPNKEDIYQQLKNEAKEKINSIFFRRKKRKEYVNKRIDSYFENAIKDWQNKKYNFEQSEIEREKIINEKNLKLFNDKKKEFNLTFKPNKDYLLKKLEQEFSQIKLPIEFSVSFEISENLDKVYIDVDLPEIEDYPKKKSQILSTNKLSVKNKSIKAKKLDYFKSISAISIYFASIVFSISPKISDVIISGYTQRLNKASGNIEDEYVYSLKFDYQNFKNLNIDNISPELTIKSFDHRLKHTAKFDLRKIEPFKL